MDQLGGYGSDAGSDSQDAPVIQADGEKGRATSPAFPKRIPDTLLCGHNPGDCVSLESAGVYCLQPGVQDSHVLIEQPRDTGSLLSKLPAPKKKRRPVLLTALARPIPDSESDVRVSLSLMSVFYQRLELRLGGAAFLRAPYTG